MIVDELFKKFDKIGLTISICGGTSARGFQYSVHCMDRVSGNRFKEPLAATDLINCFEVLLIESLRLGWIEKTESVTAVLEQLKFIHKRMNHELTNKFGPTKF